MSQEVIPLFQRPASPRTEEPGMELLIVEDEPVIGKALRQGFREAGHDCVWAKDGDKGWELSKSQQYDAIILDLMLPGKAGLDIVRDLRSNGKIGRAHV